MGFQKGNKLGRIKKGEILNPNGRPRLLINRLLGEGFTKQELQEGMAKLMQLTQKDLIAHRDNPDSSTLEICLCNSLISIYQKGDYYQLDSMFTRLFGAPKVSIDLQAVVVTHQIITLPDGSTLSI